MKQQNFFSGVLSWSLILILAASCLGNDQRLKARPTTLKIDPSSDVSTDPTPTPISGNGETVTRPSGQIYIERDYCACVNGTPDILNNCVSYCASVSDTDSTLYVRTRLGPEVELNPKLGSLEGWCQKEIDDGRTNPRCQLELYDGSSYTYLDLTIATGANTFSVKINSLAYNKTYVATIVETNSGSKARSQSFHLRRVRYADAQSSSQGPLKITPIHMYTCLTRTGSTLTGGSIVHALAYRLYYFYPDASMPLSLQPGSNFLTCHDTQAHPGDDQPTYPRMELRENAIYMWNESDTRFYDADNSGAIDINDEIRELLLRDYNIDMPTLTIFAEQRWEQYPASAASSTTTGSSSSTTVVPRLGFYMVPSTDSVTKEVFCPTSAHYESNIPVFRILKDYVGVDTEGIYVGVSEPVKTTDSEGNVIAAPEARILIRESLLKKIWFYLDRGRPVKPTSANVGSKTVMFYWPANISTPFVKKSSQKLFIVRHPSFFSGDSSGLRTTIVPPDKRFGCIPVGDDLED